MTLAHKIPMDLVDKIILMRPPPDFIMEMKDFIYMWLENGKYYTFASYILERGI
jgi:hypothetical protein